MLAAAEPAGGLELSFGLDAAAVQRRLATLAGASAASWAATPKRFYRFRTEGFIEPANHDGPPLLAVRGNVPGPAPSKETLREGARAGGEYLLRHLAANGRFAYEYATTADQPRGDDYSLPRHAGATYFLAQLYGSTRDPAVAAGAKRALAFLEAQAPPGCRRPDRACVGGVEDSRVDLGASALALLAAVEYARTTGDATFQPWAKRLAAFLRFMQKPAGDFCHRYEPASDRRDEHTRLLYYSGEAAFALARFGAPADALRGALDHLTGPQYGHLAGQFFFLEDHWTCMAAEAAWEVLPPDRRARYARFCEDFAAFLRRTQFSDGEAITRAQPDFAGAYGFTPLLPPHGTPVGSRSETAISILAMAERRGAPERVKAALRAQILAGMRFLLSHQITDDAAWLMPNPEAARGGLLMSDVNRFVRIDFVQHACSAMLRAADLPSREARDPFRVPK
ncbi:MAG TPA: hypothetical protein VMZ28_28880 [Kofleriaceae bacterium]|nr:hypothetical protein [Kofleriaceae bacterium]